MMKERIRENIDTPEELEKLYRHNKRSFESGFLIKMPAIFDFNSDSILFLECDEQSSHRRQNAS
jgi:hypothetical protein